jgi:hypothetical protein
VGGQPGRLLGILDQLQPALENENNEISEMSRGEILCTSARKFGTKILKSAYILT